MRLPVFTLAVMMLITGTLNTVSIKYQVIAG